MKRIMKTIYCILILLMAVTMACCSTYQGVVPSTSMTQGNTTPVTDSQTAIHDVPEDFDVFSFVCEKDNIAYQSLYIDVPRTIVHGGYINPNAFNYSINVLGNAFIFCYMTEEDGQLSYGETIPCGEGKALTKDITKIYFGNHALFEGEGVLGVVPNMNMGTGQGASTLYIYSYAQNPMEHSGEKPTGMYKIVFTAVDDSQNNHSSHHSHEFEMTLQKSEEDLSHLFH